MRLHIGKAFNSLKLTDYLEQEEKKVEKHDKQCSDALRQTCAVRHFRVRPVPLYDRYGTQLRRAPFHNGNPENMLKCCSYKLSL